MSSLLQLAGSSNHQKPLIPRGQIPLCSTPYHLVCLTAKLHHVFAAAACRQFEPLEVSDPQDADTSSSLPDCKPFAAAACRQFQPLEASDSQEADTAVFYSISSTQKGLAGVDLGNFLIKQVAQKALAEFPGLRNLVTLSPIPGFRSWLHTQLEAAFKQSDQV